MAKGIKVSDIHEKKIIKLYAKNRSITSIARFMNYGIVTIYTILKRNGIDTTKNYADVGKRIRKFHIEEDLFKKIDTRDKAYIFGWLMSDGCVNDVSNQVNLKITDLEILKKIRLSLNYDRPFYSYKSKNHNHKQIYKLTITSKTMVNDLIKLGCTPRKSLTMKFPNCIPEKLMPDFIRGYFDGDGSIYLFNQNGSDKITCEIGIISSKRFSKGLFDYLTRRGIICYLSHDLRHSKKVFSVRIRSLASTTTFLKFIYKNIKGQLYLKRKMKKYLQFAKNRKIPI